METFKLNNGRTLGVEYSEWSSSPREWDNLTKCIFFGSYSHVGDEHNYNSNDYNGWDEMEQDIIKREQPVIIKKVYMYVHSGETISLTPFDCRWDSGVLGFVIITKEDLRTEYNWKVITKKRLDSVLENINNVLEGEIEVLDDYISGNVYEFSIQDENGDTEDSCSGFYGSDIKTNGILDHLSIEDKELVLQQI
jgi:hypothetical protein